MISKTLSFEVNGLENKCAELTATFFENDRFILKIENTRSDILLNSLMLDNFEPRFYHPLINSFNKNAGPNSIKGFQNLLKKEFFPLKYDSPEHIFKGHVEFNRNLTVIFKQIQNEFMVRLDPVLLKTARRFSTNRWNIYQFLKSNNHDYIWQLIQSCPGLLSALIASEVIPIYPSLVPKLNLNERKDLLEMIKQGVRLKEILSHFFEMLYKSDDPYWSDARSHASYRKAQMKEDWIWLVRNASALVCPFYLLFPPPRVLIKSDLPSCARKIAKWMKLTRYFKMLVLPEMYQEFSPQLIAGLSGAISRSLDLKWSTIQRCRAGFRKALLDGGSVHRKTDLRTFMLESHQQRIAYNEKEIQMKEETYRQIELNMGEMLPHRLEITDENFKMRSLSSLPDIKGEGALMENCLGEKWFSQFQRESFYFHLEVLEKHFSLEVNSAGVMVQLKLKKNEEPSSQEASFIFDKLQSHSNVIKNFIALNTEVN